ncbi:hypothetical protein OEZ85_011033 [Tetradesmus obliquus]|uniref:DNA (cytosine-5-)-methyltransferase n=1 Tax=Tetradesmus obliquus TaxID=3088 RepID=A0ABY8TP17_TETOB|nr:hypothetical protein OEZ85_011033 [Tetradesmus obliquus]
MAAPNNTKKVLTTLDLFSGIAGITHALQGLVAPAMYCDIDPYAHKVLARLMKHGLIPKAPVWHDVCTLGKEQLAACPPIDMIISSWPCVGFSTMGKRQHFEEAGSALFYQTMRLVDITKPKAIFFENVPGVLHEMPEVRQQLVAKRKYQLRWCIVPAYSVGAPHSRERWFCLATKPGFDLQASGLRFRHAVDWSREPPRTAANVTQSESTLRSFALGNAVVPECVRRAFFYLASGGRQHDARAATLSFHPMPLIRPPASVPALMRFGFVDATNTLYPMEPIPIPAKPDLRLAFDASLVPRPANISLEQRHPYLEQVVHLGLWATPRANTTRSAQVLTERLVRDLPTQADLDAIPLGCTPAQSTDAIASIANRLPGAGLSEHELEMACTNVRDAAYRKCSMRPSTEQLKTAIAWAKQTHGIALRRPKQEFVKKLLTATPYLGQTWYLCGSTDFMAARGDMVVLVKLRLHRLQYCLAPHEEAHLQALMHLMDAPTAGLLEIHPIEGMTLQRLSRQVEEWAVIQQGLTEFLEELVFLHAA